MNSYNGKINTSLHNNKIPKEGSQIICLSVILINSVFRTGKNYYLQALLEECKYVVKGKKCLSILLTTQKLLLILIEKILVKKILMMKILMMKIKYRIRLFKTFRLFKTSDFKLFLKYLYNLHNLHNSYGKFNFQSI